MKVGMRSMGTLLAVLVLSSAFLSMQTAAGEEASERPLKIGVVNLREVYINYDKTKDGQARIQIMQQTVREGDQRRAAELQELRAKLEEFEEGSEERRRLMEEGQKKAAEWRSFQQNAIKLIDENISEVTRNLYGDIADTIRQYAQEHDYDLILKADVMGEEPLQQMELLLRINQRSVLYYKDSFGLTDVILDLVNKRYHAEKAEEAPAEEPAPAEEKATEEKPAEEPAPPAEEPAEEKPAEETGEGQGD